MATHSSIPAWDIPQTEEPAGYSPWGFKELGTTERPNNRTKHLCQHLTHDRCTKALPFPP